MIVTEEQAKKLWCPMSRGREHAQDSTHCLGSGCMLWRWAGYRKVPSNNDEAHGVCGLSHEAVPLAVIEREAGGL